MSWPKDHNIHCGSEAKQLIFNSFSTCYMELLYIWGKVLSNLYGFNE